MNVNSLLTLSISIEKDIANQIILSDDFSNDGSGMQKIFQKNMNLLRTLNLMKIKVKVMHYIMPKNTLKHLML